MLRGDVELEAVLSRVTGPRCQRCDATDLGIDREERPQRAQIDGGERLQDLCCAAPGVSFPRSLVTMRWQAAIAPGPRTSTSPMWLPSKRPARSRTARCS